MNRLKKRRLLNGDNEGAIKQTKAAARISKWNLVLLITVLACAYHLFNLVPWAHTHGFFNTRDVGLLIVLLMFLFIVLRQRSSVLFDNGFSILILFYLFFVLIQAPVVSFHFGQSMVDGLIAIRHQFYYLTFFIFMVLLDRLEKILQLMKVLWWLALVLVAIGLVNHFVVTLYYHQWAEGHMIRSGITRAYFAGENVITLALLWSIVGYLTDVRVRLSREAGTLFLVFAQILRQTRGSILGLFAGLAYILFITRRHKAMLAVAIIMILAVAVAEVAMEENIFLTPFASTYDDIAKGAGTWKGRLSQLGTDIEVFLRYPIYGSGVAALRATDDNVSSMSMAEMSALARKEDLGYTHWIKAYGVPGILWLLTLFWLLYKYLKRIKHAHTPGLEPVNLVTTGYIVYVLVSFVTLPHLLRPDLIMQFCLMLAVLVHASRLNRVGSATVIR